MDYLESIGFPDTHFISQDLFLVIARINIAYKRELFEGDIKITCENVSINGKELIIHQKVYNPKGKVAVEAEVVSAVLDGKIKRSIRPPEDFASAFTS